MSILQQVLPHGHPLPGALTTAEWAKRGFGPNGLTELNSGRTILSADNYRALANDLKVRLQKNGYHGTPTEVKNGVGKFKGIGEPPEGRYLTSGGPGKFTLKDAATRTRQRVKDAVVRKGNETKLTKAYLKEIRIEAGKEFDELVKGKTYNFKGKEIDRKTHINNAVNTAIKETNQAFKEQRGNQPHFKGKSTVGHAAGTRHRAAVHSPWSTFPQEMRENAEDRGKALTKSSLKKVRNANLAITANQAARMQLGRDRVSNPLSGESQNRIIRGEPADLVKAQEHLRNRIKMLPKLGLKSWQATLIRGNRGWGPGGGSKVIMNNSFAAQQDFINEGANAIDEVPHSSLGEFIAGDELTRPRSMGLFSGV